MSTRGEVAGTPGTSTSGNGTRVPDEGGTVSGSSESDSGSSGGSTSPTIADGSSGGASPTPSPSASTETTGPDGTLDSSFGTNGLRALTEVPALPDTSLPSDGSLFTARVLVQSDDKILVGVNYYNAGTTGLDLGVVRLTKTGAIDTTFGGGDGISTVDFYKMNVASAPTFLRFLDDVSLMKSANAAVATYTVDELRGMAFQGDKIILLGRASGKIELARLSSDGSVEFAKAHLVSGFEPRALLVDPSSGAIYVGGTSASVTSIDYYASPDYAVIPFTKDGDYIGTKTNSTIDSFAKFDVLGANQDDSLTSMEFFDAGGTPAIFLAGTSKANGTEKMGFVRIAQSSLTKLSSLAMTAGGFDACTDDSNFTRWPSGTETPFAVRRQSDGKLLVVGKSFTGGNSQNKGFVMTRFNSDGNADTTLKDSTSSDPNVECLAASQVATQAPFSTNSEARAVTLDSSGRILVAGVYGNYYDHSRTDKDFGLLRYSSSGVLDGTYANGAGVVGFDVDGRNLDEWLTAIAIQPGNGKVIVAGYKSSGTNKIPVVARYFNNAPKVSSTTLTPKSTGVNVLAK